MARHLRAAFIAFAALSIIIGVAYPLAVTGLGQVLFPYQANGSLLVHNGRVAGSTLIGQAVDSPVYFQSRPSAVGYMQGSTPDALISSGATNYSWTSAALAEQVAARAATVRAANGLSADAPVPADLLYASASGLDPHISPASAALQIDHVALARGLDTSQVHMLVQRFTEPPQFGLLGEPRVNVLLLNVALDALQ